MIDQYITAPTQHLVFGPFRLDTEKVQLWRGKQAISLRAKSAAVLSYLIHHPGRLISKKELLENVWKDGYVTKIALRVCIREIRIALGETALAPKFIETHGQQGYRFIAKVRGLNPLTNAKPLRHDGQHSDALLVGRDTELRKLLHYLVKAYQGHRQCVFVSGEAGIGKTTLLQAFLEQATKQKPVWIGYGQCVEQYGIGEAYRPVLEALSRLCHGPQGTELISLLHQYAPLWLIQMPGLLSVSAFQKLQATINETSQQSMLREISEVLEVISHEHPLILVFEDLHWSDYATIELLAVLARRPEPARLLVICTYRLFDRQNQNYPLKNAIQELLIHQQCVELCLSYLSLISIRDYLSLRFPIAESLQSLAELIHQKTEGNALFMVNTINALTDQGLISQTENGWKINQDSEAMAAFSRNVPHDLGQMIAQQLEKLDFEEQRLLRVASVEGIVFTTAAFAAGLETTLDVIEEQFETLARRWPFIRLVKLHEWSDGTLTSCYQFSHALYQNVAYQQLTAARQIRLHGLIGERLALGFGEHASEIAAELSLHFVKARLPKQAVPFCHQAGKNALQRNAPQEAFNFLTEGLQLLQSLTEDNERNQLELELNLTFGPVLMNNLGYSAPEVKRLYDRARILCQQLEETQNLFHVLVGIWSYYLLLGELKTALELGQGILALAQQSQDDTFLLPAHYVMATTLQPLGTIEESQYHAQQGMAIYNPEQHHNLTYLYAEDPGISCFCQAILNLWITGYADQAKQLSEKTFRLVEQLDHSLSSIQIQGFTSVCLHYCRDLNLLCLQSEKMISLSEQQNFPFWLAAGHLFRGWVRVRHSDIEKGMAEIQQALKETAATGAGLYRSYYLGIYADACIVAGQLQQGLDAISEALACVNSSGERVHEAELYRLQGELQWQITHDPQLTEACFQKAIAISRQQSAKFFELRASMDLSRLWQQQGKQQQAWQLLSGIYAWFDEGFSTPDLQDAKNLVEQLALHNE